MSNETQNTIKHKGYYGSVEINLDENIIFGKVLFVSKEILYQAVDAKGLKTAFEEAVDRYLDECSKTNTQAEKPCKGSLNVRLGADLHLDVAVTAHKNKLSINSFIVRELQKSTRKGC